MCLSILTYHITDTGVSIRFLNVRLRHIPFSNIEGIYRGFTWKIVEVWTVFKVWDIVTIKKKTGLLKYVTITPPDPDKYVAEVQKRLAE